MQGRHDEVTDVIRRHWDRHASTFDETRGRSLASEEQHAAWLDLLSRLAGSPPIRVLDVGCGTGFLALMFAELGHAVTGIDLSPRMIDRARRKAERAGHRIDFRASDASAVDVADGSFDLVVARHVIWILSDPEQAVAEWRRVLSPGGRLALIEGRWGDEDGSAQDVSSSPPQRAAVIDVAAALVRPGRQIGRRLRNRRYRHIAERLPFFGGAPPERLAEFLASNAVHDVDVQPLMDPALWREPPQFPRYLVTGTTRALRAARDA